MPVSPQNSTGEALHNCAYVDRYGLQCPEKVSENQCCSWHSGDLKAGSDALREQLESRAREGLPLTGFQLSRANLSGVNLVGNDQCFSLADADLYRADLKGAHLFRVDLHGASLMKADLTGANLHCADLRDCNLLGARFDHARLENVLWGESVLQEERGFHSLAKGDVAKARQNFQEAEEIYRELHRVCGRQGLSADAGFFYRKEMRMRRYQMPRLSASRSLSWLVDQFCGYGEQPIRIIVISWVLISLFALLYFILGISGQSGVVGLNLDRSLVANLSSLVECGYFSIVTFTTLGYGDLTPLGWTRAIAALEAFIGSFTMALFVVVFVKKMTR